MAEIFNIPRGPIDDEPLNAIVPDPAEPSRGANVYALGMALAGVELGDHDRRILFWLAGWESSTVATVCSWLYRKEAASRG